MKREGLFTVIYLILIILLFPGCKGGKITIILDREISDYDQVLLVLFNFHVKKTVEKTYTAEIGQDIPEKLLQIAPFLPYIKSIRLPDNKIITNQSSPHPQARVKRLIVKYTEQASAKKIKYLETFCSFRDSQYLSNIDVYSYRLPPGLEPAYLIIWLKAFPFIAYLEEDLPMKVF